MQFLVFHYEKYSVKIFIDRDFSLTGPQAKEREIPWSKGTYDLFYGYWCLLPVLFLKWMYAFIVPSALNDYFYFL